MAVIRNGAVRTTEAVDVLVRKGQWPRIRQLLAECFVLEGEGAVDRETRVPADFLFSEDDWNMIVPLPDAAEAAEYDSEIEANFLSLPVIFELKTAV